MTNLRKYISIFLAVMMLTLPLSGVTAFAETTYDGFNYSISGDEVTITGYTGTDTDLVIPAVIDGNTVTTIGTQAFYGCDSMQTVTIPDSVTTIEDYAFGSCDALQSVTVPDSVTTIGSGAFSFCAALTSVTIGSGVESIGGYAFLNCTALTEINVSSANNSYCSVDGVLFTKDMTVLMQYPTGSPAVSYTIPNGVTDLGASSFANCVSLESVIISDTVTEIQNHIFSNSAALTNISIGKGVTCVDLSSFSGCTALVDITVSTENYGYASSDGMLFLNNMSSLIFCPAGKTSATVPSSVTEIDHAAFSECSALTDVYYSGTTSEWSAVTVADGNDALTAAVIHCSDGTIPETSSGETSSNAEVDTSEDTSSDVSSDISAEISSDTSADASSDAQSDTSSDTDDTGSEILRGDTNLDGMVSTADALLALRHAVGLTTLTGDAFTAGEMNGDGTISTADALIILRVAVGMTNADDTSTDTSSEPLWSDII